MSDYQILVVDDDPVQRETLQTYLELADYQVAVACDGAKALEYLKQNKAPDLVLMDVEMPEMDGFTAIKKMQAMPELRRIPVVFLTAVSRPHLKVKGLQLGAEDYITKPFERAELLARVKARLRSVERAGPPQGDLAGTLGMMGIDTLLQSVCTSGRQGVISLPSVGAEIRFQAGEVLRARLATHEGAEAVARLMLVGDVPFSAKFQKLDEDAHDNPVAVQQLLMDAAVMMDDVRRQLEIFGEPNPLLDIARDVAEFPELQRLQPLSPLHLDDLLVRMNGNLSFNSVTLVEAHRRNKLNISTDEK